MPDTTDKRKDVTIRRVAPKEEQATPRPQLRGVPEQIPVISNKPPIITHIGGVAGVWVSGPNA